MFVVILYNFLPGIAGTFLEEIPMKEKGGFAKLIPKGESEWYTSGKISRENK